MAMPSDKTGHARIATAATAAIMLEIAPPPEFRRLPDPMTGGSLSVTTAKASLML